MSTTEDNLREALRASKLLNGDPMNDAKKGPRQMPPKPLVVEDRPPEAAMALMRMVDFRIPLPWLLGGFIVASGSLVSMYFQLKQVTETLGDLKITVAAGNGTNQVMANDLTLLKFRVQQLEKSVK